MPEKAIIPAIRFKGFTDAWEQRKLGTIADKVTEKNTELQYVETLTNSAEFGIISQRDFFDHNISKMESIGGYYIVRNEDFVYNPRISTTAPVGPVNRNKLVRSGVMSPLYTVFRTHDVNTTYLEHYFKSRYWHPFMYFNGDSGTRSDRFSIKDATFMEIPIPYPDIVEQEKICDFLTNLDNLITLHQRKLLKLKNVKKAMLEKMFPKKGSKVPEIRFAEFTDAWEQRKLGDLTEVYDGTHQTPNYTDSGIMFLSVENIKTLRSEKYISEEAFKSEFKVFPEKGDVLMTRIGDIGTANVFDQNEPIAYYVSLALLKCKELDPYFLKESIYSETVKKDLWHRTLHIAFPKKINKNEIEKVQIPYPESILEQKQIGAFFRNLDNLITLHQRKYEKLQNLKKACLEKMFV